MADIQLIQRKNQQKRPKIAEKSCPVRKSGSRNRKVMSEF